jgi:hypothetical protein
MKRGPHNKEKKTLSIAGLLNVVKNVSAIHQRGGHCALFLHAFENLC